MIGQGDPRRSQVSNPRNPEFWPRVRRLESFPRPRGPSALLFRSRCQNSPALLDPLKQSSFLVFDSRQQSMGFLGNSLLVSSLLSPVLNNIPIRLQDWIYQEIRLQIGQFKENIQLMGVARVDKVLLGEIVLLGPFRDARLQRAFNRISCQIVCAIWETSVEQHLCFLKASFRDFLKISPIHEFTRFMI